MKWFFQPSSDGGRSAPEDDDSAPGLLGLPAALLERHGGRVLDPAHAGVVDGYPRPRHTVYRARTLLIPEDLLQDGYIVTLNEVLRPAGMLLDPPQDDHDADSEAEDPDTEDPDAEDPDTGDPGRKDPGDEQVFQALGRLPRVVVLIPVPGYRRPVDLDAWTALQILRAATVQGYRVADEAPTAPEQPILDKAKVDRIELEHLLVGSTITGSPATEGGGGIGGGSGRGSDVSGPGITDSYTFSSGDTRAPVAVLLDQPERRKDDECKSRYGRRPVIAVLDSGVRAHWWLDVAAKGDGYTMPENGFVAISKRIQGAIRKESERAAARGDKPRRVIEDAWDTPVADNPLIGELNQALGHCTFIAGIVRQVTPDARVLVVRVLHSDDVAYEGDIICGLRHLARRIALAQANDRAAEVDIVSLSFGYFSESRHARVMTSGLWQVIKVLLSLGVVVVAAAGNQASSRKFYPAAFALEAVPADQVPVFSVGALNPDGTKAMFSNDGDWVTAWAAGACVISTYPTDVDGSRTPQLRIPANRKPPGDWPQGREALDPDDYSGGFAFWSGTSFAAPYGAALIARSLLKDAEPAGSGLKLNSPGTLEKRRRAVAACADLPRSIA
jgi:subtilase family protein